MLLGSEERVALFQLFVLLDSYQVYRSHGIEFRPVFSHHRLNGLHGRNLFLPFRIRGLYKLIYGYVIVSCNSLDLVLPPHPAFGLTHFQGRLLFSYHFKAVASFCEGLADISQRLLLHGSLGLYLTSPCISFPDIFFECL